MTAEPTIDASIPDDNSRVVDSAIFDSARQSIQPNDSGDSSTRRGRITLNDLKKIIERDDNFSEVTVEQIERVRLMHDKFMEGSVFSFNYNTLLLVASVIAGLGLVSNSTATIIASMLVSPIMGPVIALGYGTTISDRKMVWMALKNEVISLVFCVLVGVIIGACTGWTGLAEDWPTDEMKTRCTIPNLLIGIPIAFFSGLGVAVSLLDDQTNSLVGVAISASLLPPAVNSGIVLIAWYFDTEHYKEIGISHTTWRLYAFTSLGLTLVNIVMIWISSILMFRMKEVLPIEKKVFWTDLGIARKIYKGKALLAHQAFDPEVSARPQLGRRRSLWRLARENVQNIPVVARVMSKDEVPAAETE